MLRSPLLLLTFASFADVRTKLEAEHERLAKELDYRVPAEVPAEPKLSLKKPTQ